MTAIPRKELREGRVLVHNDATPQRKIREHGFRAWTQLKTDRLVECHCDWAGVDLHGLPHYRMRDSLFGPMFDEPHYQPFDSVAGG